MRRRPAIGMAVFALLGACNAILGNEDQYSLSPGAAGNATGASGNSSAGSSGTLGSGGKVSAGGKAGMVGPGGAPGNDGPAGSSGTLSGAAGDNGAAGSASCVPNGPEDCFNGTDDDCNGDIDCADSACQGPAMCVPNAAGAELGTRLTSGTTCPQGYTGVTLHRGLSADPQCTGCTCTPSASNCNSSIVTHYPNTCGFQTTGVSYVLTTNGCATVGTDASVHYYAVGGEAECTPQGTAKPSTAKWAETTTYCKADHVGGGCASGWSCVPNATTPACALSAGTNACAGNYPTGTGAAWNTGLTDKRTCSACQCGLGLPACTGGKMQVYSSTDCSGNPVSLGPAEGDTCPLPFVPKSGKIVGTPASTSCPPNTYANGMLTADGESTVCCR
jgi:hypothetical protein